MHRETHILLLCWFMITLEHRNAHAVHYMKPYLATSDIINISVAEQ